LQNTQNCVFAKKAANTLGIVKLYRQVYGQNRPEVGLPAMHLLLATRQRVSRVKDPRSIIKQY